MAKEIITQMLPCELTEEEMKEKSLKLAAANQATAELEKEKKQVGDQFKARQSALESEITALSGQITTGKEYRKVDCEWQFDWQDGVKYFRRLDTYEDLETRKITEDERQGRLID